MAPTIKQLDERWAMIRRLYPDMAHLGYGNGAFMFGLITLDGGYIEIDQMGSKQGAWDWMTAFLAGAEAAKRAAAKAG